MADRISLLLVVFTAAVALLHLIYRWWNAQRGQRKTNNEKNQEVHLPPGSTGWPLIGETYSYYRSMTSNRPRQFIDDREKRGGRLCPGSHLARFELALFLHIFITRFRWEALADQHPSYFPLPYLAKGFPRLSYAPL